MSILIEMESQNNQSQQQLIRYLITQQLNSLINHPEFSSINLVNSNLHHQICLTIPRGEVTFVKDTRWTIKMNKQYIRVTISLIDQGGLCYLRAQSQRMKLQLMILLKMINSDLPIPQQYFVDPKTGILYYNYQIAINQYIQKLKRIDSLKKLFKYMLSQLNNYIEIILFCQPSQTKYIYQNNRHFNLEQVNRYRLLLKNTRQIRQNGMIYMKKIMKIKKKMKENQMDENLRMQLDQTRSLFHNNIKQFDLLSIGVQQNEKNNSQLQDCVKHIHKIAQGSQSRKSQGTQSQTNSNKIVNGIIIYKNQSISVVSKQGAHSQIFKGNFMYEIVQTINFQVVKKNKQKWITGNIQKTQLIFKKCNTQMLSSRNSFINQICLLNHLRDSQSKYIAKYYLELKNQSQRTQNDYIYMKPYSQNLYQFIKNSRTLSMADRLAICYRISKGLCFLGSKYVLHRDFKPHNVMIDQFLNPFIIDFGSCAPIYKSQGFSVKQERLLTTKKFHINYNEIPEQYLYLHQKFTRDQYNFHPLFDVYSFGRIISYIFFNSITEPNEEEISTKPYPQFLSNILFLIKLCLEVDPDQRPAFAQITSFLGTLHVYMGSLQSQFKNRSQSNEINTQ